MGSEGAAFAQTALENANTPGESTSLVASVIEPRVITIDKNAAYPPAIDELKQDKTLPKTTETRQIKYPNNIVEQDHRFIKRKVRPGLSCSSFNTTRRTFRGYEVTNMIRKGQIKGADKGDGIG